MQSLLQIGSSGHSISPDWFDQYMYPYPEADTGITRDFAQEPVDCIRIS